VDKTEIERIAHLARLQLTPAEIARMEIEMNRILEYVAKLEELDTSTTTPMHHVFEVANFYREDEIQPSMPKEKVLANAPDTKDGLFRIPDAIK
jgi:aspartyl-tRNA(Asn)/glutamyl-tRNA(Gln) amidotransferase subunit C